MAAFPGVGGGPDEGDAPGAKEKLHETLLKMQKKERFTKSFL
jgi:hypothetical protein